MNDDWDRSTTGIGSQRRRTLARLGACTPGVIVLALSAGCAAVYPEHRTPLRDVPEGRQLEPPPPDELLFIHVTAADIPQRTRDGRQWDEVGGKAPDPFVKVFVDDEEIYRTDVESNTLRPTWDEAPDVNFRIPLRSLVRLELWDKNTMQHRPICQAKFRDIHDDVFSGGRTISCDSGARVRLDVEAARPKMGMGMKYEVRSKHVVITRVYEESPADRAELSSGQRVVSIQGKPVSEMVEGEARSLINANARTGVTMSILEADGATRTVTLKEGPIYPVAGDGLTLD